jgi:hypothetical protein
MRTYLEKNPPQKKKRVNGVLQGEDPKIKPQYCKNKKTNKQTTNVVKIKYGLYKIKKMKKDELLSYLTLDLRKKVQCLKSLCHFSPGQWQQVLSALPPLTSILHTAVGGNLQGHKSEHVTFLFNILQ